ncbi:MAG: hypothetical protein GY953_58215, partial [bacterium]|nr:hypothetical protein [bacterium]
MRVKRSRHYLILLPLAVPVVAAAVFVLYGCNTTFAPSDEAALFGSDRDASGRPAGGLSGSTDRPPSPSDIGPDTESPPASPVLGDDSDPGSADRDPADPTPDLPPIETPVVPDEPEPRSGEIQSGILTAGAFDDNLNFEAYQDFVSDMLQNDPEGQLPDVSLGNRVIITVANENGEP